MKNIIPYQSLLELANKRKTKANYYLIRKNPFAFTGELKRDLKASNKIIDKTINNNTAHNKYIGFLWAYDQFYGEDFNHKWLHKRSGEVSKFTTRFDIDQVNSIYSKMKEWCECIDIKHHPIIELTKRRRLKTLHIFNILISTGMRGGELAKIDFMNQKINRAIMCNYNNKQYYEIIINTEKTCKKREIYIPAESYEFLKRFGDVVQGTQKSAFKDFSNWSRLGFGITAHCCRRTLATMMHEAGVDIPTIAMVLGNSVGVVMRHYILSSKRNYDACEIAWVKMNGNYKQTANMFYNPAWMNFLKPATCSSTTDI